MWALTPGYFLTNSCYVCKPLLSINSSLLMKANTEPTQLFKDSERVLPSVNDNESLSNEKAVVEAQDDSRLPLEVRAIVPLEDDPDIPVNTFRAWLIAITFSILGTAINTFFQARQPVIHLTPFVAQFISFPVGIALAKVLPVKSFRIFGKTFWINPDNRFNEKEHMLITVMAQVAFPVATAADIIVATKLPRFLNNPGLGSNVGWQILICLSIQFFGFGMAGLARRFLVYPTHMVWPIDLAKISLNRAMHSRVNEVANGWEMGKFKFLLLIATCSFLYFFLPGYSFAALLHFNWPTWIAPNSAKLAAVMGTVTGLGFNPLPTFDWSYCNITGLYPLITPWNASVQLFMGAFASFFIIIGWLFGNVWYSKYLLPNSNAAFDNTAKLYNTSRVLLNGRFNEEAYLNYSPMYFSPGKNILVVAYFAVYTAILLHAALYHGRDIVFGIKTMVLSVSEMKLFQFIFKTSGTYKSENDIVEDEDPHYLIMKRNYKEVPEWWYLAVFIVSFVVCCVTVEVYDTGVPIWSILLANIVAFVFLIPAGIIYAISNIMILLAMIGQILPGYLLPGNIQANMTFKLISWVSLSQALLYISDLKLGQYMKIPPRTLYFAQLLAGFISTFVTIAVVNWQMSNIQDFCSPTQNDHFTCPYYVTFFTGAQLWGVVGPHRIFGGRGGIYGPLMWSFLGGAVLPVFFWILGKKWEFFKKVSVPVLISGPIISFAPYNLSYAWSQIPLGWLFQSYIRRRYFPWWYKYNYVLSTGLTIGVAFGAVIVFFVFQYSGIEANWPGNTKPYAGCDGKGCPILPLPEKGYFGPGPGEF